MHPSHSRLTLDLVFMLRVCATIDPCVCEHLLVVRDCVRDQGNLIDGLVEDVRDNVRKDAAADAFKSSLDKNEDAGDVRKG